MKKVKVFPWLLSLHASHKKSIILLATTTIYFKLWRLALYCAYIGWPTLNCHFSMFQKRLAMLIILVLYIITTQLAF